MPHHEVAKSAQALVLRLVGISHLECKGGRCLEAIYNAEKEGGK